MWSRSCNLLTHHRHAVLSDEYLLWIYIGWGSFPPLYNLDETYLHCGFWYKTELSSETNWPTTNRSMKYKICMFIAKKAHLHVEILLQIVYSRTLSQCRVAQLSMNVHMMQTFFKLVGWLGKFDHFLLTLWSKIIALRILRPLCIVIHWQLHFQFQIRHRFSLSCRLTS